MEKSFTFKPVDEYSYTVIVTDDDKPVNLGRRVITENAETDGTLSQQNLQLMLDAMRKKTCRL